MDKDGKEGGREGGREGREGGRVRRCCGNSGPLRIWTRMVREGGREGACAFAAVLYLNSFPLYKQCPTLTSLPPSLPRPAGPGRVHGGHAAHRGRAGHQPSARFPSSRLCSFTEKGDGGLSKGEREGGREGRMGRVSVSRCQTLSLSLSYTPMRKRALVA